MGLKGQRDHACAAVARPTGPGHADKLTLSGADHGFECVGNTRSMRQTPEGGRKGRGVSVGIGCVGIGAALGEARGRTDLPEIVGGSMDRKIVTDGPIAPMTRGRIDWIRRALSRFPQAGVSACVEAAPARARQGHGPPRSGPRPRSAPSTRSIHRYRASLTPAPSRCAAQDLASRRVYSPFRRHLVPPGRKSFDIASSVRKLRLVTNRQARFGHVDTASFRGCPETRRFRRFETS